MLLFQGQSDTVTNCRNIRSSPQLCSFFAFEFVVRDFHFTLQSWLIFDNKSLKAKYLHIRGDDRGRQNDILTMKKYHGQIHEDCFKGKYSLACFFTRSRSGSNVRTSTYRLSMGDFNRDLLFHSRIHGGAASAPGLRPCGGTAVGQNTEADEKC